MATIPVLDVFLLVPRALGHIGGHSHLVDTSQGPPHVRELRRAEVPEAHGLERQQRPVAQAVPQLP